MNIDLPLLAQLPSVFSNHKLNGSQGINRETTRPCQIAAQHDYEAVQVWLNEYKSKPNTFRTYQKEAERLLLWAIVERKKPLSSIDRDDFTSYLEFLDDPQPRARWCAKVTGRSCQRGQSHWRPFTGPLSHSAKMTALSVLDSLFSYLVAACYLAFNPLALMRRRHFRNKLQQSSLSIEERMLSIDEWHRMLDILDQFPEQSWEEKKEKARLIFIVNILYFLGLRINELATHTWHAFRKIEDKWWFYVLGKGDKIGKIPVNDELLHAIIQYRQFLKLAPYPASDEVTPLIASFTTRQAITPRHINKLLKKLAIATANSFADHPEKAKKLKKFSAHWLRHLSASMQDRSGVAFKHIRANHRHENDETTRRYVHALDKERHSDMQKLRLRFET